MKKLEYDRLVAHQEYWKTNLPDDMAKKYLSLSKILMHRVIENNNNLSGVTLNYPQDCSDFVIFRDFVEIVDYFAKAEMDSNKKGWHVTF